MVIADGIIIILLALGAYKGYKDGFLVTILSFLAFIIAILAALKLLDTAIRFLKVYVQYNKILPFVSFILVFLIVFVGIIFLSKALKSVINKTLFGSLDSAVGALFGILKIAFGISLLLWLVASIQIELLLDPFKGSFLFPIVVDFAPKLVHGVSYIIPFQDIFSSLRQTLIHK